MKNERLKQFALSFTVVLSLFASSFAAVCTCSSHEQDAAESSHCQQEVKEVSAHRHSHENSVETVSASFSETDDCCCVQSAPRAFAKTESVKIEKQTAAVSHVAPVEFKSISQRASIKTVAFAAPFYLSDSFHNLTPGRAPPRS